MSSTPTKSNIQSNQYRTPVKSVTRPTRNRTPSLRALEHLMSASDDDLPHRSAAAGVEEDNAGERAKKAERTLKLTLRKSKRNISPPKRYTEDSAEMQSSKQHTKKERRTSRRLSQQIVIVSDSETEDDDEDEDNDEDADDDNIENKSEASVNVELHKPSASDLLLLEELEVAGRCVYGFNTPRKRDGMSVAARNTPKTPKTPKTPSAAKTPDTKRKKCAFESKTPRKQRHILKNQIAKRAEMHSGSDFSAVEDSDYAPSAAESDSSSATSSAEDDAAEDANDEPKTPQKARRAIIVPVLPKTPSAARLRQSARIRKSTNTDYVPESDGYFQSHSSSKILTSDHTLDRLKNPRLPADRLFTLLAQMKLSNEHEQAISAMMEEYKTYFPKWMYLLNEGFNILLYGLGSKRDLLLSFHREILAQQTVLVVNGFFPSLTIKDILDSITSDILDAGSSPANSHEAVDAIEEEFALIPETHLYLIVHNIDGSMLRSAKAQAILARLAKVPNIHLLASIDHINTPLLWDQTKYSQFNFSWWDCTTMLSYSNETAFENSLLVQNSGELALSSLRSVFSSLTSNSRGIYMIIVKYQLENKTNPNYQGMLFKDLYWSCREAFLVSSDLALRAQLTEFIDHKLVKTKRSVDGSELLVIPIDATFLQQFLEEQQQTSK